jgi:UDP-glucose 4-epimerase
VDSIIHFAGSISVPESLADPMAYYQNNTVNSFGLVRAAIETGVRNFVFSSTAAVYGTPDSDQPISETAPTRPQSPYGNSKLMTETMLADAAAVHDFRYVALRYFNVSGADPKGRTGQSTSGAINLIKVATETAMGKRDAIEIFGTDYPTRDGTCVRDFIHVADLVAAHVDALGYLRQGGDSLVANCGYGRGYTVNEVLASVRR